MTSLKRSAAACNPGPALGLVPRWTTRRASRAFSAELGRHEALMFAAAVQPDEKVVTGWADGRVLVWEPGAPGAAPDELGRHEDAMWAVAVLADGRVVTGGRDLRVLVWDPARPGMQVIQLSCLVSKLATAPPGPATANLVIAHQGSGLSLWSFTG
jgi:hypothetical protein